jgi:hypothetical protein
MYNRVAGVGVGGDTLKCPKRVLKRDSETLSEMTDTLPDARTAGSIPARQPT